MVIVVALLERGMDHSVRRKTEAARDLGDARGLAQESSTTHETTR